MHRTERKVWGWVAAGLLGVVLTASAEEDWQHWTTWSATHRLSDQAALSVLAEAYFRDDMREDYVYDEYITYAHEIWGGLGFVGQTYFESVRNAEGQWGGTRSVVAGPTYTVNLPGLGKVKVEDRFFYRLNSPSGWDYHRPRVSLSRTAGPLTLVLADEFRLDLSDDRPHDFYRNRIFVTAWWKLKESVSLGLGYLRQSDRSATGEWSAVNGLHTLVAVTF